ncbi:hypothetical protein KKG31_07710 [Patescibacteria group bacterium]|nr:hypothetical protein [Patescibacteria group bacterium]MBU1758951.1 hypothetical protein [Patescibacteria group bacterium]
MISNIKKSLNQSFTSALTITSIFTSVRNAGGLKDIADGFAILFKNKVFFRDYKRLMEIDGLINNKKYELGL